MEQTPHADFTKRYEELNDVSKMILNKILEVLTREMDLKTDDLIAEFGDSVGRDGVKQHVEMLKKKGFIRETFDGVIGAIPGAKEWFRSQSK